MEKVWKASWIMDHRLLDITHINVFHKEIDGNSLPKHREDLKNVHMLVRKKFYLFQKSSAVFIDITADDYYKLYINGIFVGQGPAAGYFFHYNYNRFNIASFLKEGENVVAVHVYYQGLINRVWNSGDYRQGMIAEIYDGDGLIAGTDATWKYTITKAYENGGSIGYDTQLLENINGRFMEYGWKNIEFDDDKWMNACENSQDDHKLFLQPTFPLDIYEIKPENIKKIKAGHYLIDFGHEITGQLKMKAKGHQDEVIEIRCAEELLDGCEDEIRYNMRCNCTYREFWTLSGDIAETLEFYDYKAFRYAEVIGSEESIDVESICAIVRHYPFDDSKCTFGSSNSLLNSIWDICKNGVRYGTQENYVDCPSREKGQYLGDNTVIAHSHIYLTGDMTFFKKSITDFARSAFICPGLMGVAPGSFMQEVADFSLQWPIQLMLYYKHSGDRGFLEEMYPVLEGLIKYFKGFERLDGLLENVSEKWNIVDWPDNLRDGYDFALTHPRVGEGCHNVINSFYYNALKVFYEISDILGVSYINRLPELKKAFISSFYNKKTGLFVDSTVSDHSSLHSNILPLLFGITQEGSVSVIIDFIKEKRISCGVYMAYFLLKALASVGEHTLLFDLLSCTDERSWGNMVKEGATTCFEAWGKDQKWNTSLCHAWASAPISIIIEDIAGVTPYKPGWEEIRFNPHIPDSIEYMALEFEVARGRIKMEYKNGTANINVPEGVEVYKNSLSNITV